MCWWKEYKLYIKNKDTCRNFVALIMRQYHITTGNKMTSVVSKEGTRDPHTIDHEERCGFAAIIAAIVGEPPNCGFDKCIEAAAALKKYKPCDESIKDGAMLTKLLVNAMAKDDECDLSDDIKMNMAIFSAAIIDSFKSYNKTGKAGVPDGAYSLKYLYDLL